MPRNDATPADPRRTGADERIDRITHAAIGVFARQGYSRTSMADLAAAAGMSRPALYQYFGSRPEVFRAAMGVVLRDAADAAVAALDGDGALAARLDAYLQAAFGDPNEQLATAAHGDEIIDAKHEFAADVADEVGRARRRELRAFLRRRCGLRGRGLADMTDLLELAPIGLKADASSPEVYRRRLSTLARSVAAVIEASVAEP